jgi:RimJ/RimL family protein N-acetyltransferase
VRRKPLDNVAFVIETERLVLRVPRLDDATALLEFVGDEEVMRRIGDEPGGHEKAEAFVDRWLKRWERNGVGPFIVELDGTLIGRVGLLIWDRRTWETSAYEVAGEYAQEELGWALVRRAWGFGYATEAAEAVKSWSYQERGIERLVSLIAPDNVRSQRVAEKLGARVDEQIQSSAGLSDVWAYPDKASAARR